MKTRLRWTVLCLSLSLWGSGVWAADGPGTINYQARLVDAGELVNKSGLKVTFTLYDAETGGNVVYRETNRVNVVDGLYSATLGGNQSEGTAVSLLDAINTLGSNAWLGVTIGAAPEFVPRERLGAVPFALKLPRICVKDDGKVGIGTDDPKVALHVVYPSAQAVIMIAPDEPVSGGDSQVTFAEDDDGTAGMALYYGGADDQLKVYGKNGAWIGPHMVINRDNGHVGIGTNNPSERLVVAGTVKAAGFSGDASGLTNVPSTSLWSRGSGDSIYRPLGNVGIGVAAPDTRLHVAGDITVNNKIQAGDATGLKLATDDGETHLHILDNGRIGMGTDTPKCALHVVGNLAVDQKIVAGAGTGLHLATSNGVIHFSLANSGNVGIGEGAPKTKLHVEGTLTVDQKIQADDGGGLELATDDGITRLQVYDSGRIGVFSGLEVSTSLYVSGAASIGTGVLGSHALTVKNANAGAAGSTVHVKNDNAAGIGLVVDVESTDRAVLINQRGSGHFLRCDSWDGETNWEPVIELQKDGTVVCKVLTITGGSDLAEPFDVMEDGEVQPGMVVSIDADHPGKLRLCSSAYDTCVAGVVSGAGGISPGVMLSQEHSAADGAHPVALTGRVYCWADASDHPIVPGDLLTTSDVPGHAMKAADPLRANGSILGKAMSPLSGGRGLVLTLVALQ